MKSFRLFALALLPLGLLASVSAKAQTLEDANRYVDYEQYGQARTALTSLYRTSATPENAYYLGNFYIAVGQPDSARTVFQQALAADEKNALLHVGMGELALISGNGDEAEKLFEQAEKLSRKRSGEIFYRIGKAYTRSSQDFNEAVDALDQALKLEGQNPAFYTALGDAYLEMNDAGKATANYDQALAFDAGYAPALGRSADVYVRAKQYSEAIRRYRSAVEADPTYTEAYLEMANLYRLGGQYGNAAENLQLYLNGGQGTPDDWYNLASYQYANNQFAESVQTLERIRDTYTNPIINRLYAYNYNRLDQPQQGYEQINTFLQRAKPEDLISEDFEIHGRLALATGADTTAALASLRRAAEMDTAKKELYRDIAQVLYSQGQYAASAQEYETMAAAGAELSATDRFRQGQGYYFGKEYEDAARAFTAVTEAASTNNLGWLYLARSNAQIDSTQAEGLARPAYEKYIEITTDTEKYKRELIEANYYLGSYAWQHGDKENAERHLNAVLALDPSHANAKTLIDAVAAGQFGEFASGGAGN